MGFLEKKLNWRICYAVCCVVYAAWVVYLSLNNFNMVHGDYRRGGEVLQPVQIKEIARQELVAQCRKELKRAGRLKSVGKKSTGAPEDACLSWPSTVLEERQKAVEERIVEEQSSGVRKLVLFYIIFGIFFLILPPVLLYLLISLVIWVYRSIKVVR